MYRHNFATFVIVEAVLNSSYKSQLSQESFFLHEGLKAKEQLVTAKLGFIWTTLMYIEVVCKSHLSLA